MNQNTFSYILIGVSFLITIAIIFIFIVLWRQRSETYTASSKLSGDTPQGCQDIINNLRNQLTDLTVNLMTTTNDISTSTQSLKDLYNDILNNCAKHDSDNAYFISSYKAPSGQRCLSDRGDGDIKFVPQCAEQEKIWMEPY